MTVPFGTNRVHALTTIGYNLLQDIAREHPGLLRTSTPEELHHEMLRRHSGMSAENTGKLFSPRSWPVHLPLSNLTADPVSGRDNDAAHAEWLHEALPTAAAADMSDRRVLAAINCFHLPGYSNVRWESSTLWGSKDSKVQTKFVINHWLGDSKESNTVARLWWLYEFARRVEAHSNYDTDTLLKTMANHVNFYHQLLRRAYLRASARIWATILDVSIENGLVSRNNTRETSRMMQRLNLTAGGISLDILCDDDLREVIEGVMPPKEEAAPDLRH